MYISTVTKQGQISIPIKLRKKLNIDQKQVLIREENNGIFIKPLTDLLDLKGSLKTNIKATPRQIKEAFGEYLAKEAVKGIK
jgi:AbrB family looped-hinge helix DNA binding protein